MGIAKAPPPEPVKERTKVTATPAPASHWASDRQVQPRGPAAAMPGLPAFHAPRVIADHARDTFLARVRREVLTVAETELEGTGWSAQACPYLEYWLGYYQQRTTGEIEAALRHYARGARA